MAVTTKFKTGDHVVVVSPPDGNSLFVGREGIVKIVRNDMGDRLPVLVDFGFTHWNCEIDSLKLDRNFVDVRLGNIKK